MTVSSLYVNSRKHCKDHYVSPGEFWKLRDDHCVSLGEIVSTRSVDLNKDELVACSHDSAFIIQHSSILSLLQSFSNNRCQY